MAIVLSGSGKIGINAYQLEVNGKSIADELNKALKRRPGDYSEIIGRIKIVLEPLTGTMYLAAPFGPRVKNTA